MKRRIQSIFTGLNHGGITKCIICGEKDIQFSDSKRLSRSRKPRIRS
jgi:hypothetical protein